MNESYVKKVAKWVLRRQSQINYKYWHKLRRGRRHIKWVAYVPGYCFLFFSLIYLAVAGSEKLLGMSYEDIGMLNYLVMPAELLTKIVSSEAIIRGVEVGLAWFFSSWIVIFTAKLALWLIPLTLVYLAVWRIADLIVHGKQQRDKERVELLQQALRPIPTRSQVAARFVTVLLIIWLGLRWAESMARRNGICLLDTNDQCEYMVLNDMIWLTIAAVSAAVSINGMHKARVERNLAKRKLVAMRESWLKKVKRQVRPLAWAVITVLVMIVAILFASDVLL